MIDCETADWAYGTARVMGSDHNDARRYEHAVECERSDWTHALETSLWSLAGRERERRSRHQAEGGTQR